MKTAKVDSAKRVRLSELTPGHCYQVHAEGARIVLDRVLENTDPVAMTIRSKEEADLAVEAVCRWLKEQTADFKERPDALADNEEPEQAEVAREWCQDLLKNARAAGSGGCRLCRA